MVFHLRKIWGLSHLHPDLFDAEPELLAVLCIGGAEVARSPEMRHPPDPVFLDWQARLHFKPRSSRIHLELWDLDFGVAPEILGTVVWNPGRLRLGRSSEVMEEGISLESDVLALGGDGVVWEEEVIYLTGSDGN